MTINMTFAQHLCDYLSANPASITRWLSTPAHNAAVGGAPHSGHLAGNAVDLVFDSEDAFRAGAKAALDAGFMGIEADVTNNHLHLDEQPRIWRVVHHGPDNETPLEAWLATWT